MKKRIRKAGILLVVFVAAIFVSSLFMNSGVDDQIIDLGDPTLPRISFQKEGRTVNALAGYVNEMDVTAMRDTITPLEANGTLQIQIEEFGNKITGVEYKVYSLNGEETYLEIHAEKEMLHMPAGIISTETLGMVRIPEAPFDGPDGESIVLDTDYNGAVRCETPAVGPLEGLKEGYNKIKVWG